MAADRRLEFCELYDIPTILSNPLPQDLKAAEEAEQAAEEVAADPHAVERKKLAEAEEWRLQQLRTGQAAANANFQVSCSTRESGEGGSIHGW